MASVNSGLPRSPGHQRHRPRPVCPRIGGIAGQVRTYRFSLEQPRAVSMDLLVSSDAIWETDLAEPDEFSQSRFYSDGWFPSSYLPETTR